MEVDVKKYKTKELIVFEESLGNITGLMFQVSERIKKRFSADIEQIESQKRKKRSTAVHTEPVTLYEMSFLKKMISGEFNNSSVASFSLKKDKNLFEKFKGLSKKKLKETYEQYQKQLDSSYSK